MTQEPFSIRTYFHVAFGPVALGEAIVEETSQFGRELWLACWMVAMYEERLDAAKRLARASRGR